MDVSGTSLFDPTKRFRTTRVIRVGFIQGFMSPRFRSTPKPDMDHAVFAGFLEDVAAALAVCTEIGPGTVYRVAPKRRSGISIRPILPVAAAHRSIAEDLLPRKPALEIRTLLSGRNEKCC
jgi:hypothetical protein